MIVACAGQLFHEICARRVKKPLLCRKAWCNEYSHRALYSWAPKRHRRRMRRGATAADPELTYDVYNIDDEKINTLKVKRSEISFN